MGRRAARYRDGKCISVQRIDRASVQSDDYVPSGPCWRSACRQRLNGKRWGPPADRRRSCRDPTSPKTMLAGTSNALVFRSSDGAEFREAVPFPLQLRAALHALVIHPGIRNLYFAGVSPERAGASGMWRSADVTAGSLRTVARPGGEQVHIGCRQRVSPVIAGGRRPTTRWSSVRGCESAGMMRTRARAASSSRWGEKGITRGRGGGRMRGMVLTRTPHLELCFETLQRLD